MDRQPSFPPLELSAHSRLDGFRLVGAHCSGVIPGRAEGANPESIVTAWGYGFRVRRSAAPRNDDGWFSAQAVRETVDSRDNRAGCAALPRPAYTGRSGESLGPPHALFAPIPRRVARAASGLGGRGPAREAQEGGARVEGTFPLQQGEDALVLRQRPEDGVVRLLLRQERQHLRFRDADGRGELSGSGGAARGAVLRGDARLSRRRESARLPFRSRHRCGNASQVSPRLRAGRALRAQGAPRQGGNSDRADG